ncbi:amino acid ABC transporter ATP-binding/permease protein [Macrococcus sp. EM39E]|uniref:amino acid ABC transporter ATP-binding/permease protein n=1 Tax=Macrococcus animalis TaxID=3395467 RepID=UPI0039BE9C9E
MRYISDKTRKSLVISIIIGTIGGLTAIGMFSLSGLMLSKSAYKVPLYTLMTLVATIKLFGVIRAICKYFERLISHEATFEMLKEVRVTTVRNLLNNFIKIQTEYQLSTLLNRTVNDIEKLQNLLLRVIYPPTIAIVTTIVVIFIYLQFSLYAVIVLCISMFILTILLPMLATRFLKGIVHQKIHATKQFEAHLLDYHLSEEALVVFDQCNVYQRQLKLKQHAMEQMINKENRIIIIYDFLLNFIAMVSIFLTIFVMMYDPTLDILMYLSMVMVAITLFEMSIPMIHYPYHKVETDQSESHLNELNQTINYEVVNEAIETIELVDVNIDERLSNINLKVNRGDFIGIAGPSGAGKSTLLKVILGLENVRNGYYVNGKAIQTPANMLDCFNVMEQENHFINGTVSENMFIEKNKDVVFDNSRLNQLLKHFNLPFTSESEVHSFGENLSGGEKKRLHFIRMILRDQPVWILDEPFNGVDKVNQKVMLDYLNQLNNKMIILVSHDLTVFNGCDRLYLIEKGSIVEAGEIDLLHRKGSQLYALYQKQLLSI